MKKLLLTAATIATLASSSAYATEDVFYVKGNVGWDKLNKVKGMKSKNDIFIGLGVGYYVMDNVRTELSYDHYINPTHKGTFTADNYVYKEAKLKTMADTLMINGFVDLFDVSVAKVFAGAGIGMSMVSSKLSYTQTQAPSVGVADNQKYKKKNNFTWALHVGGETELAPGTFGGVVYSYRDMGNLKTPAGGYPSFSMKGHHVAATLRFDL